MNDFFKDIIKTTGNEYAALASDGIEGADVDNFVDTGSYIYNKWLYRKRLDFLDVQYGIEIIDRVLLFA